MILHNPTESAVTDYPVQDPKTKEVKVWSINPGETLEFPDHVGKYLLDVYGFLQKVMTEEELRAEEELEKKKATGQVFSQVKIVKAEGEVVETPAPTPGYTNEVVNAPNPVPMNPPESVKPLFICPKCHVEFGSQKVMKNHYADKHLEL